MESSECLHEFVDMWCDFPIRSTVIETLLRMRTTCTALRSLCGVIVSSYKDMRSYDDFERDVKTSPEPFEANAKCYLQPQCH